MAGLASVLAVFLLQVVVLSLELLHDSLEGLYNHLELAAVLALREFHLDVVVGGLAGASRCAGNLVDLLEVLLSFVVDRCRELVGAHLVLLEDLDSLLKPGILEVVGLFLEFKVQDILLGSKELILGLCLGRLALLELLFELFDSELSEEAELLSLLDVVQ